MCRKYPTTRVMSTSKQNSNRLRDSTTIVSSSCAILGIVVIAIIVRTNPGIFKRACGRSAGIRRWRSSTTSSAWLRLLWATYFSHQFVQDIHDAVVQPDLGPGSWQQFIALGYVDPAAGSPARTTRSSTSYLLPLFTIIDGRRRGIRHSWLFFVSSLFTELRLRVRLLLRDRSSGSVTTSLSDIEAPLPCDTARREGSRHLNCRTLYPLGCGEMVCRRAAGRDRQRSGADRHRLRAEGLRRSGPAGWSLPTSHPAGAQTGGSARSNSGRAARAFTGTTYAPHRHHAFSTATTSAAYATSPRRRYMSRQRRRRSAATRVRRAVKQAPLPPGSCGHTAPKIIEHTLDGEKWRGFAAAKELDDVSPGIALISLPGHTRGRACVAVDAGHRWVVHCGDAFFHHGTVDGTARAMPRALAAFESGDSIRSEDDAGGITLGSTELYRRSEPDMLMVCSHGDRTLYEQPRKPPLKEFNAGHITQPPSPHRSKPCGTS